MLKWARRIFVFLVLGAIVNVAVAWGCVVAHGEVSNDFEIYCHPGKPASRIYSFSLIGYQIVSDNDVDAPMYTLLFGLAGDKPEPYTGWMWWPKVRTWEGGHIGVGWPAPALCATVTQEWGPIGEPGGRKVHTRLDYGYMPEMTQLPDSLFQDRIPMIFPYRPVWAGFAANTLLYGAVLAAIAWCARYVRRARRLRRGQCPACGYPRGTSPVCTECGEALAGWASGP